MNRLNLLVAALSLYTGCANEESAPQELQAFLESLADSGCEALAECAPARDSQAFVVATVLSSRTACQAYIKSLRKARVDYESLVANGVLDFDAAQAGRCASAFKGTCEEYSFEDLPECRNVFRGHANIGAECDRTLTASVTRGARGPVTASAMASAKRGSHREASAALTRRARAQRHPLHVRSECAHRLRTPWRCPTASAESWATPATWSEQPVQMASSATTPTSPTSCDGASRG